MASIINATTTAGVSVAGDNSGSLQLATNNGTTAVTIDTSQNVGIGTSSPSAKLNINGGGSTAKINTLDTFDGGASLSTWMKVGRRAGTGNNSYINTSHDGSDAVDALTFAFGTSGTGTERMRISSTGNVGIGTTSPNYKLQVVSTAANQEVIWVQTANANTGTGLAGEGPFALQNTNTTVGNMAAISNFDGNGNINTQVNFINIDQAGSGAIGFTTRSGGSYAERMRVTESGGTRFQCQNFAAQPSSTNGGVEINNTNAGSTFFGFGTGTETHIAFGNTNGIRGTIQTTSGGTSYNTTSDYRLKENVASMTGALAKVSQLKPSTYTWKVDGSNGQGFIAHELQEVIPDCVTGEKDGFEDVGTITDANGGIVSTNVKEPHSIGEGLTWTKTGSEPKYQMVDTSFLVATLTAAIQELNAKVEAQAVRIAELEGAK